MKRTTKHPASRRTGKRAHARKKEVANVAILPHLLRSTGLSLLFGLGLLVPAALAVYFTPDPGRLARPVALIVAALTAFVAGVLSRRRPGASPFPDGLLAGCALLLPLLLCSLAFRRFAAADSHLVAALLHLAPLLLSTLGACVVPKRRR